MGPGQRDRMSHSSDHSRIHLPLPHPSPPPVVGTQWGFGIGLLCSVVFFRLAYGTVFCIYLYTEDQKLVWRQFPCLAPLPLHLVGIWVRNCGT